MTTEKLSRDNKIMMLAYDQGLEHGPVDFDDRNYDPKFMLDIARDGGYTCVAMQCGIASKFWKGNYEQVPLVLKLNGKTNLGPKALSVANCTVDEAVEIGASAIGYTIYVGSEYEAEMFREFSQLRKQAHANGLPVFAWMYPFITPPSSNDDELEPDIVAYAARVGAELGADVVKIKFPTDPDKLNWVVKNAVGTQALLSGGDKLSDELFLGKVKAFMDAGGAGLAVGRNAWQHENPLELSRKIGEILFS